MTNTDFLKKITEGSTDIFVHVKKEKKKGPGTKKSGIPFYNPTMELNRDLSIAFVEWLIKDIKHPLKILDGLSSSGIRGVRIANEVDGDFKVFLNDWDKNAYKLIKKNVKNCNLENAFPVNSELNALLSIDKFDYIDIDPFGSPVYFFDSSIRSIKHNGVISFTATDTATLCGVYNKVCRRRYDAEPFHGVSMKEVGMRILMGSFARSAARHEKGIMPLISYVTDHYFRCYVRVFRNTYKANDTISQVKNIKPGEKIGLKQIKKDVGPLWTGEIQYKKIFKHIRSIISNKKLGSKKDSMKLIDFLESEANMPIFYFTTDSIASSIKKSPPKKFDLINNLEKKGYHASYTHFDDMGFKTNAPINVIEKMFKQ